MDSTHGSSFANPCSRKENQKAVGVLRKGKKGLLQGELDMQVGRIVRVGV